jgi:hypothetical protein
VFPPLRKYPRTPHIEGSRLQPGDEDLEVARFRELQGKHLVVEEKIDGSNVAIRFDGEQKLLLQSRGHYLTGGPRERQYTLLKRWVHGLRDVLYRLLSQRYVLYGEWLYAKHTVFYDQLPALSLSQNSAWLRPAARPGCCVALARRSTPLDRLARAPCLPAFRSASGRRRSFGIGSYFLEFDVLDLERDEFLSTERRRALLDWAGAPIVSVPVLSSGPLASLADLVALIRPSLFKGPAWREKLREAAAARRLDVERVIRETDPSDLAEGLYIKVEEDGVVQARFKYVRAGFAASAGERDDHWLKRRILPNQLKVGR